MLEGLQTKIKFLNLVKNPTRTDLIFDLMRLMLADPKRSEALRKYEQALLEHPDFVRMYREGWIPRIPNTENVRTLPKGTLGEAYIQFLDRNGFKQDFYPVILVTSPATYLSRRLYEAHDLLHVLTGYDSTPTGEVLLQAFQLGQVRSPASAMLMVAGLLGQLDAKPENFFNFFNQVIDAFQRGAKAHFILASKFEVQLHRSLADVRQSVGLENWEQR